MTRGRGLGAALERLLGGIADPRIRVGVDLVHIPRVAALVARHGDRWLADHFSTAERAQLDRVHGNPMATVAGRLAAKESFIKVLSPHRRLVLTRDVEVLRSPGGAPQVHPRNSALDQLRAAGIDRWTVSITHEGDWAVALAAGLSSPPHPTPEEPEEQP